MNDLGVSLHAHNGDSTFLAVARRFNALDGQLEVDPKYLSIGFGWPDRTDSPLRHIKRTIPVFGPYAASCAETNDPFTGTLVEYGRLAHETLKKHLREHWDATRPTLFCHSSGYDSRILSSILAELRDEGFDLGRVHFRCRPPEERSFVSIMATQRWEPSQYSVFRMPDTDPLDVGVWERPGVSPWLPVTSQINFWRDIVPYEDEKHWNLIGGSGGGEAVEYPSQPKPPTVPWQFCANKPLQRWFSYFPDGTDFAADVEARFAKVLFPYFGAAHVRTIARLDDAFLGFHPSGCDNVRAAILAACKYDVLETARLPRTYAWSISPARWDDMEKKYAASAFLRETPGAPPADVLIAMMKRDFFTSRSQAERIWRFAAVYEVARAG